ncbi:MAG: hypothetical protein V3575_00095, partial [Candidatus Absconditabacteria bacterium]
CTNYAGCTYSWQKNSWSACNALSSYWGNRGACNKTCGGGTQIRSCVLPTGTQTRSIYCLRSDGTTVSNSSCTGAQPTTTQTCSASLTGCGGLSTQSKACNTQSCCNISFWSPDAGTVCSNKTLTQTSNCGTTRVVQGTKQWSSIGAQSVSAAKAGGVVTYNSQVFPYPIEINGSVFTEDLLYRIYCYDAAGNITYKNVGGKGKDKDDRIDYAYFSCVANRVYIKVQEGGGHGSDKMGYTVNGKYCE